jgi:hypothetical protein
MLRAMLETLANADQWPGDSFNPQADYDALTCGANAIQGRGNVVPLHSAERTPRMITGYGRQR